MVEADGRVVRGVARSQGRGEVHDVLRRPTAVGDDADGGRVVVAKEGAGDDVGVGGEEGEEGSLGCGMEVSPARTLVCRRGEP